VQQNQDFFAPISLAELMTPVQLKIPGSISLLAAKFTATRRWMKAQHPLLGRRYTSKLKRSSSTLIEWR
jgi:hypothetical protein